MWYIGRHRDYNGQVTRSACLLHRSKRHGTYLSTREAPHYLTVWTRSKWKLFNKTTIARNIPVNTLSDVPTKFCSVYCYERLLTTLGCLSVRA
jgi:hypothetical protein